MVGVARMRRSCAAVVMLASAASAVAQVPAGTKAQRLTGGFDLPIFATAPTGDNSRLFVAQQGSNGSAQIRILNLSNNTISSTPFLTVTGLTHDGGEQGLLGLAFHPNFATNGRFFVNVTAPGGAFGNGITQIREYTVSGPNPLTANVANTTFRTVLSFDQPQTNHNGGWIGFSPRSNDANNLYIASGDGGNENDTGTGHVTGGNAQSTSSLLGKMLRINVGDTAPTGGSPAYTIPSNNPFATSGGAKEVFAYGLRNPFRSSFDRGTGNLYMGDVGQNTREEVDVQLASRPGGGDNYQWRLREGTIETPTGGVGGAAPANSTGPIDDYARTVGTTITGGYVYRGSDIPGLVGTYLYGDFTFSKLFALRYDGTNVTTPRTDVTSLLAPGGGFSITNPSSFAEDGRGELYILDYADGEVYRIVPEPTSVCLLAVAAGAGLLRRRRR